MFMTKAESNERDAYFRAAQSKISPALHSQLGAAYRAGRAAAKGRDYLATRNIYAKDYAGWRGCMPRSTTMQLALWYAYQAGIDRESDSADLRISNAGSRLRNARFTLGHCIALGLVAQ